jgi:hypothetical protein
LAFSVGTPTARAPETSSFCPPGLFYHLPDLCVVLNDPQQDPMGYGENDPFRDFSFGAI